ncbi:MAG TPA: MarR family transcriptional regulator [Pirellulales bacterium]|nr:MarR family transcriptional regulator [Pirellulales bacterium]
MRTLVLRPASDYTSNMPEKNANQDDDIGYQILRSIRKILRRTSEHSRQLLQAAGLTVPQLLCLRAIGNSKEEEATLVFISRAVGLSNPTVSRILDRLENAGYIRRERGSSDRRKMYLQVTPTGRQRLDSLPPPLQDEFLARVRKLSKAKRMALLHSLEEIVDLMEAGDLEAAPILVPGIDVKETHR